MRGKCHNLLPPLQLLHRMVQKENEQQNHNHHRREIVLQMEQRPQQHEEQHSELAHVADQLVSPF